MILDSNVWLDIVLFDDPVSRPIHQLLCDGRLEAVIDARCLDELERVLQYPQFTRFGHDWQAQLARVTALTRRHADDLPSARAATLPRCADRDDQKFLELACDAQAAWLISKDRAVLKLASRIRARFGYRIATPERFLAAIASEADAAPLACEA